MNRKQHRDRCLQREEGPAASSTSWTGLRGEAQEDPEKEPRGAGV